MIKRLFAAAIISVIIPVTASAQVPSAAPPPASPALSAGVTAGLNFANISSSASSLVGGVSSESYQSKTGLIVGAFVRARVTDSFSIQPEALFSQQGAKLQSDSLTINYLQVPILGVATFHGSNATPFVVAGPALGLRLNVKASENGVTTPIDSDQFASMDLGVVIGAGVNINKFMIEARYTLGLKNITPTGNAFDFDTNSTVAVTNKSRVFAIMVGYRFQ